MERRRFKQTTTLDERLDDQAKGLRQEASGLAPGVERDRLMRKASQIEIATHINEWLSSPGLQPPR